MGRKGNTKRFGALLLAMVMTLSLLPAAALAAQERSGEVELVTPQCAVTVSSGQGSASLAVDGNTASPSQWASDDMKSGVIDASTAQTPQWLTVDLGADHSYPVAIDSIKLWYNVKVWPMVYEIQTTDNVDGDWTTLVRVERDPSDSAVKNAAGQNIADETGNTTPATAANTDTITKASTPALAQDAAVRRYVRFYVEKVNASAPGNNVCLREIQIYAPAAEPEPDPEPIEGAWNLALNQPTTSSGCANDTVSGNAVDGDTTNTQWNSLDIKDFKVTNNSRDNEAQAHPQWLQIDLGEPGSKLSEIRIHYVPNNKVWAMAYEIKTTNDPVNGTWDTLVSVSRPSANKTFQELNPSVDGCLSIVTNDGDVHADVITRTSAPKLSSSVEVGRYVRIFFNKTNAQAPGGDNVNVREVEILGANENRRQPVDKNAVLALATNDTVSVGSDAVTLPDAPAGGALTVAGSTLENVVTNDGSIGGKNIGARDVTLLIRAWDEETPDDYAQKNLTVTIPDHKDSYPAEWFPSVTAPNPKPEVIPALQEWYGYEGSFTLTKDSRIVLNDVANAGLRKVAENMKADLLEITGLDLPIVTAASGGAKDIYIESLTDDAYDLGQEGYLLRVSDEGVKIYAPTYTGCLFGTITVEQILWLAADHLSVPMGIARDYPAYAVRGLKIDIGRAPTRYQFLEDYAKIMLWYKMSEYDLHINDTENPNASNANDSKNNIGFHRLESDTFPSLKLMDGVKRAGVDPDLVDADYYNDPEGYGGNPVYTKQQWKDLAQLAKDYGMYLLTEIDMPGHALAYNKYVEEYPEEAAAAGVTGPIRSTNTSNFKAIELLELVGPNAENALKFAKALWNEYTADGTITGDVVHIGADEYWLDDDGINDAFARFADELRQTIQNNLGENTKIRMWGATSQKFSTATTVLGKTNKELAEDFELEIWATGYDNPVQRSKDGYRIVNCEQSAMYSCPGRYGRDVPNAEYLFNSWDPTKFGGAQLKYGDPNLLGAKAVMWGEQTQEGLTERDIHQRLLRAVAIISEKTWSGVQQSEGTFSDYEQRAARLAEGPGTQIAMNVPSQTALVLDYDFSNLSANGSKVYDASGNGYDAALTGGSVDEDGWLTFDGSTLLTTDLTTLSYPYTVSFDLKADAGNTEASSLFSGYDGRIQVAGHHGNMSANACSFIRDLNYAVPTDGTAVNITIVGTQQAVRLYVNGQREAFLSQTEDKDGVAAGAITSYFSSVPLPLEKIGEGLHGALAHLKVYNRAFSADEVAAAFAGTDDALVNIAQNAVVGGSSFQTGDVYDNGRQRTAVAQKAVDGEEEEMYSFWQADHADSALTVDLGESHPISQINASWRGTAPSFTLQTSEDGKSWTNFTQGTATQARFVKLTTGSAGSLQELMVYEQVDKTALADKLTEVEAVVEENALGFGSSGKGKALFDAVVLARAVAASPLSTNGEAAAAAEALQTALDDFNKPTPTPTPNPGNNSSSSSAPSASTTVVTGEDGSKVTTVTTKDGDKTITVTDPEGEDLVKIEIPAVIPEPKTEFEDLDRVPWAEEAVNKVAALELVKGTGGNKYDPVAPMTRGSLATVLHRLSQGKTDYEVAFKDVAAGRYYTEGVAWAAKANVVTGYTAEIFAPDDIITREQLAVMLARYAKLIGMDTTADAKSLDQFVDADKTGDWAVDGVAWCVEKGLLKGKGMNNLDPTAEISRAEVAVLLDRFIALIKK